MCRRVVRLGRAVHVCTRCRTVVACSACLTEAMLFVAALTVFIVGSPEVASISMN